MGFVKSVLIAYRIVAPRRVVLEKTGGRFYIRGLYSAPLALVLELVQMWVSG